MAERYSNPFVRYFDTNAALLNGGKLNFYVDDGGTTRKNTYSDEALTTANANPVVLTASGVVPDIFLSGAYKVVLTDADDVQIDAANNVNVTGFTVDDANNNTVTDVITMTHTTSGTPAAGIGTGLAYATETAAGNNETGMTIDAVTTDVSGGGEDFKQVLSIMIAGTLTSHLETDNTALYPTTNDAIALGKSAKSYSDLFVASGGVINFNAGDVTLTHSSNLLTLAGGTLYPASGIQIGGTVAANLLDDYEEGTFTFGLEDGSSNAVSLVSTTGAYVKIGQLVFVSITIDASSLGSASGAIRLTGLPFAALISYDYSLSSANAANLNITAGYTCVADVVGDSTTANLYIWDAATGTTQMTAAELSADGDLALSGCYRSNV